MNRIFLGLAVFAMPFLLPAAVAGKMAPPSPIPLRVAQSQVVVLGKVTGFEPKTIRAERWQGDMEKGDFQIAVVKIGEGMAGVKGLTHIKVGFVPTGQGKFNRGGFSRNLAQGQEYLLFLQEHPSKSFLWAPNYFDIVAQADNEGFKRDVANARISAKALENPIENLKSKDAEHRLVTAAALLSRYRVVMGGVSKKELIPAEESKLILKALADADWGEKPDRDYYMSPQNVFGQLNLTQANGWTQPANFQQFPEAAKKWLNANAETHQLYRLIKAEKE